jgi:hypothetical protein
MLWLSLHVVFENSEKLNKDYYFSKNRPKKTLSYKKTWNHNGRFLWSNNFKYTIDIWSIHITWSGKSVSTMKIIKENEQSTKFDDKTLWVEKKGLSDLVAI